MSYFTNNLVFGPNESQISCLKELDYLQKRVVKDEMSFATLLKFNFFFHIT